VLPEGRVKRGMSLTEVLRQAKADEKVPNYRDILGTPSVRFVDGRMIAEAEPGWAKDGTHLMSLVQALGDHVGKWKERAVIRKKLGKVEQQKKALMKELGEEYHAGGPADEAVVIPPGITERIQAVIRANREAKKDMQVEHRDVKPGQSVTMPR